MSVVTNSPAFPDQLALNRYWQITNGSNEKKGFPIQLPGTSVSPDRFVRASHYTKKLSNDTNHEAAVAGCAKCDEKCCTTYKRNISRTIRGT